MDRDAAILDRLAAIEAKLDRLAARRSGPPAGPAPGPHRLSKRQAAAALSVSVRTVEQLVSRRLLTPIRPAGPAAARNARVYFDPGEVAALAAGEDEVREYQARTRRRAR